ncbi:MAG: 16S rRNA processing protein RimM [Candidatus Tokpelaia sp. JSC085]|nr:MAG: 16S rRNA processing protein RimM [Candidatus Tokpelaia sp. JSC085]
MAVISTAHGTGGEVRVRSFAKNPIALGDYGPLHDKGGQLYWVKSIRLQKTMVIVRFIGGNSRTLSERLNGTVLFIDRTQLPDNLEEDEFYQNDLLGFEACDELGQKIGYISAFFNFGGGDLVELMMKNRKNQLIPFSKTAIPHIDMAAGRIYIDPVASGLA